MAMGPLIWIIHPTTADRSDSENAKSDDLSRACLMQVRRPNAFAPMIQLAVAICRYPAVERDSCNVYEERVMYQKIVVALDGSESSRWALYEALDMAQLTQARLHAVYIVHPWGVSRYAGYVDSDQLRGVLREDGRIALDEARRAMTERGVPGDTEIEETENAADDVAHCLGRCVQRQGAGLVVMGTQGRHGIGRLLLGSVAEAFLRRVDVPVLVVRSPRDLDGIP